MSIQEKKALLNIVSSVMVFGGYVYYTFCLHADHNLPLSNDPQFWGEFFIYYIPIVIGLKIISFVLFTIVNKIATNEDDPGFTDERDKLIELKSDRNGNYFFFAGLIAGFIYLAMDYPIYYLFICLFGSGLISDVTSELWKFYFYRRGI